MCGVPVSRAELRFAEADPQGLPRGRRRAARRPRGGEAARPQGGGAARRGAAGNARHAHRGCRPVSGANNFLTAVAKAWKAVPRYHLASLDISTGEFLLSALSAPDLEGELLRQRIERRLADQRVVIGGVVILAGIGATEKRNVETCLAVLELRVARFGRGSAEVPMAVAANTEPRKSTQKQNCRSESWTRCISTLRGLA